MVVGRIVDISRHPDADSLYVEQIDIGVFSVDADSLCGADLATAAAVADPQKIRRPAYLGDAI